MLRKAYTIQYCIIWAVPKFPYSFSLIWLTISMIWCTISVIATGSLVAYLTSSTHLKNIHQIIIFFKDNYLPNIF